MLKRIALALVACLWASLAFGQAPAQQFQQGLPGSGNAGYPPGATPSISTLVNTTNGATTSTTAAFGGTAGQFTYICGWNVFTNGGAAQDVNVTVSGPFPGPLNYLLSVPAFAATNAATIGDKYQPCIRGVAVGVSGAVLVTVPAQGTGNTNVTINMWGYQE